MIISYGWIQDTHMYPFTHTHFILSQHYLFINSGPARWIHSTQISGKERQTLELHYFMLTELFWRTFFRWACVRNKSCVHKLFLTCYVFLDFFTTLSVSKWLRNTTNDAVNLSKNFHNNHYLFGDLWQIFGRKILCSC